MEPVGSGHCSAVYNGYNTGGNRGQCFPSYQPHHHSHHEGAADRSWFVFSALLHSAQPWSIFLPCESLHSSALRLLASVDQTRLCVSPLGSLLFHRLLSRSLSLCRKSPDGCNEKFSSHSHSTYFLHTHSQHTQCRKLGCLSAWNDYSSSNEKAAGRVIDYSLNRDGQANTPAQMSVFSSGCVCVCLRMSMGSSWIHSDIPVMKVTGIIHLQPWLQLSKLPQWRLFHGWMAIIKALCV